MAKERRETHPAREELTLPAVCDWCGVGPLIDPAGKPLAVERWLCASCASKALIRTLYVPCQGQTEAWVAHICRMRQRACARLPLFGGEKVDQATMNERRVLGDTGRYDRDRSGRRGREKPPERPA